MITEVTRKDYGAPLSFALPDTQLPGNSKLCKIAACIIPFLGLITSARIYLSMKNKISLINVDNVLNPKNNEIVKELRLRSRKEIKTYLKACLINLLIISAVITCILIPQITPHLIIICIAILLILAFFAFINKITKNSAEKDLEKIKITIDQAKIYDECSEKQNEELLKTSNSAISTLNEIINFYDTQKATNVFITEEDDTRLSNLMRDLGKLMQSTNHYPHLTGNPKTWTKEYIKIISNQRLDHHTERVIAINAKIVELRHCFNEIVHRLSDSQKLQLPHIENISWLGKILDKAVEGCDIRWMNFCTKVIMLPYKSISLDLISHKHSSKYYQAKIRFYFWIFYSFFNKDNLYIS